MTAGRPVGNHIRNICASIEESGPSGIKAVRERFPEIEYSNASKYCSRAVGLGLMTVERGRGSKASYCVFTVVPGWREMAEKRRTTKLPPATPRVAKATRWQGVNSVFSIGAI